jgi:hypothetical protein
MWRWGELKTRLAIFLMYAAAIPLPTGWSKMDVLITGYVMFAVKAATTTKRLLNVNLGLDLVAFTSGSGPGWMTRPRSVRAPVRLGTEHVAAIEEWATRLDAGHVDGLRIAASRLVSALGTRSDHADALIDAVTAWEALVGTRQETVFPCDHCPDETPRTGPGGEGQFQEAPRRRLRHSEPCRSWRCRGCPDPGRAVKNCDRRCPCGHPSNSLPRR